MSETNRATITVHREGEKIMKIRQSELSKTLFPFWGSFDDPIVQERIQRGIDDQALISTLFSFPWEEECEVSITFEDTINDGLPLFEIEFIGHVDFYNHATDEIFEFKSTGNSKMELYDSYIVQIAAYIIQCKYARYFHHVTKFEERVLVRSWELDQEMYDKAYEFIKRLLAFYTLAKMDELIVHDIFFKRNLAGAMREFRTYLYDHKICLFGVVPEGLHEWCQKLRSLGWSVTIGGGLNGI